MLLLGQKFRIVRERLQDVGDLPEGIQHRLLVIRGGRFEGSKRGPPFSMARGAVENWLDGKTADDFDKPGVRRDRTSALQVWCEAIGGDFDKFRKNDAYRIGSIMRRLGWEAHSTVRLSDKYGRGRGFVRGTGKMLASSQMEKLL